MKPIDCHGRPLRNLRLSVTDRCNLRCSYCMPEPDYVWLPRTDVLSFEEIVRLLDVLITLGVDRVRLTGGEPLLRTGLPDLIGMIKTRPAVRDLALTSNGVLLREHARELRSAGLQRLTVSLDTLDPATFRLLTGRDHLERVLNGITAAREAGFDELKLDTVVIDGVNDSELLRLLDYARSIEAEVRFIEYMDVGGATHWRLDRVVSRVRMLRMIEQSHGAITPLPRVDSAPADRFRLADGTTFGIISSVTQPFCASCNRTRLTADGQLYTCLYATEGTDLRAMLRGGAGDDTLRRRLLELWNSRRDRGAEQRAALPDRGALAAATELRQNPHREMHTRGG